MKNETKRKTMLYLPVGLTAAAVLLAILSIGFRSYALLWASACCLLSLMGISKAFSYADFSKKGHWSSRPVQLKNGRKIKYEHLYVIAWVLGTAVSLVFVLIAATFI
ncbi:MAG: hypothetical protein LBB30_05810 [Candidatus Methanoplasma sp.]|jgi:hypothetical protein|nr:hypothetical protein [Candidatus Methanoplasma sp.]